MPSLALAAIGRDRPGIVAAVARVLFDLGCNVEDSSMTLLRGNFSMMLVVACPDDITVEGAREALRPACEEMGLTFSVLDVGDTADVPEPTHILTVYGGDKPGILYRTCAVLAEHGVNITDLNSRLVGEEQPVYAVMLELEVPRSADAHELEAHVRSVAAEIGVDVTLRERETDVL
jgi:glycine cleavage system transcriptional repressor